MHFPEKKRKKNGKLSGFTIGHNYFLLEIFQIYEFKEILKRVILTK